MSQKPSERLRIVDVKEAQYGGTLGADPGYFDVRLVLRHAGNGSSELNLIARFSRSQWDAISAAMQADLGDAGSPVSPP